MPTHIKRGSRSERVGFFAITRTKISFSIDFSFLLCYNINVNADLAHLVERNLAKVEVAGSIPVIRSKKFREHSSRNFFIQAAGLVMESRFGVYGIRIAVWHHLWCIFCGLMICNASH